jgi:MoaA/NifB/PqqE/SkfB family radical SAM enzyme
MDYINKDKLRAMTQTIQSGLAPLSPKLWVYTNYDCNLRCAYCLAESHPRALRRGIGLQAVEQIVDEALELGFEGVYFTGGEPFLLDEICTMLAYASARLPATVLTNAMLFAGRRFEELVEVNNERLTIQVSLDGSQPQTHDIYRGEGSWQKTMEGIRRLLEAGFRVRISTTETPANQGDLQALCSLRSSLGIPDEEHVIRPLAKRGFSQEGRAVGKHNLAPEMTVNADGVYWHPSATDADLLVRAGIFPLAEAVALIQAELGENAEAPDGCREEFQ